VFQSLAPEVGVLENLLLEGVGAEALQRILDQQLQDELLPALDWLLCLVFGEHNRVELDERFRHLGAQVRLEGIHTVLGFVEEAAENPEGRRW